MLLEEGLKGLQEERICLQTNAVACCIPQDAPSTPNCKIICRLCEKHSVSKLRGLAKIGKVHVIKQRNSNEIVWFNRKTNNNKHPQ